MFEYDTIEYYTHLLEEKIIEVWRGCQEAGENDRLPWVPYDLTRAKKIWMDFMTLGIVKDEKGLERMANNFVEKIATIEAITILAGHTEIDPQTYLEELKIEYDEETEDKLAYYILDEQGIYRLSDSKIGTLQELAGKIIEAKTPVEKLLLLDRILNVVHPRSDIASWFIKGGRYSLDELKNQ